MKCKVAELLEATGQVHAARGLLHEIDRSPDCRPPAARLIHLAISLDELEFASEVFRNLNGSESNSIAEPICRLLSQPRSDILLRQLPAVRQACASWKAYPKLSAEAQDSWCSAVVHQHGSGQVTEIRKAWERHSVVDFALAVEIELKRVLQTFKDANRSRTTDWVATRSSKSVTRSLQIGLQGSAS